MVNEIKIFFAGTERIARIDEDEFLMVALWYPCHGLHPVCRFAKFSVVARMSSTRRHIQCYQRSLAGRRVKLNCPFQIFNAGNDIFQPHSIEFFLV